jgi:biopolymer transport protein ExbB
MKTTSAGRTSVSVAYQLIRLILGFALLMLVSRLFVQTPVLADESADTSPVPPTESFLNIRDMLAAGGTVGYIIMFLSFLMVALIIDHLLNIRRATFMPPGLAEEIHRCLNEKKLAEGIQICDRHPSFLGRILRSGLEEVPGGHYPAIEKAMEDTAAEQSARYFRRIEYLGVISTLAPMLGLMGTVWGMILAFMEFEMKANPQISELAPGVYKALITTLQGLGVAIPATAALAFFRSRVEELAAESTLLAAHVFSDIRRASTTRRKARAAETQEL